MTLSRLLAKLLRKLSRILMFVVYHNFLMNLATTMFFGISLLNIISWVVFGLIVGYVVHLIDPRDVHGGVLGTLILGILGAIVGGYLAKLFFGNTFVTFSVGGFIAAVVGGLILAFVYRLIFHKNDTNAVQKGNRQGKAAYVYSGTKGGQATTHTNADEDKIVNPIQVEKYLKHVDYPASKDDLLQAAQKEGADSTVLHTIEEMPNDTYDSPVGVSKAIGSLK